jgi:NAD(P)-dependent dehydrogenase (short-subunit alcohol dehydrogenase family)
MTLLAGKRALVTGGAHGIGRAIAARFLAEGAHVAVVDREPVDGLEGGTSFRFDLAETERLGDAIAEAEAAIGPLDVLVNNAGVFEPAAALELRPEAYRAWSSAATDGSST